MSVARKKYFENGQHIPWNKGKHLSEEHRHKLSDSHKGKPSPTKSKAISQEHKDKILLAHTGKSLSEYYYRRISEGLTAFFKQRKFERRSNALKEFYKTHTVRNKGLSWSEEVRERIREGCLNSSVGMGPRGPWNLEHQQQEIIV